MQLFTGLVTILAPIGRHESSEPAVLENQRRLAKERLDKVGPTVPA
jgi:hypothetical protein